MGNLLFFADKLPPHVGGMEVHADYFIKHFTGHQRFPLWGVITKDQEGKDLLLREGQKKEIDLKNLPQTVDPKYLFFNSGRWIEELELLRDLFPHAVFLYRTGGNEIIKAPLIHQRISSHPKRQLYWIKHLNSVIDVLITNSHFTEKRLQEIGITCPFVRCVGGVNVSALHPSQSTQKEPIVLFCAARFVPYKNHHLLISVIKELVSREHLFKLKLAGDGPNLEEIKNEVSRNNLSSFVEFLGSLGNEEVCNEIANASVYIQLSGDQITKVPGGSYVHAEGMGRSILEAITAGTFVVAGKSGALDEIVTPHSGILVDLDSAQHIADCLEELLLNLPPRREVINDFDWENIFKRYEKVFTSHG
ncbi:MAG: GDP-mannose-dependent alpha-(1-6)-phosphatidylinositol monomannoside mannosyltransferase [Chlamydiae bacterium]|nr:GDP-mannose-dependent alpha-(1-6)-phosphatidylinositol monomannoside mannosyltransferase [Chlamydiota bacterium]